MKILIIALFAIITTATGQSLDSVLSEYERQREAVLRPLEEKYDSELAKLLQKLTSAGKLEESMEVDRVVKERTQGGPRDIVGSWLMADGSGLVLTIEGNGIARVAGWPKNGRWVHVQGRTLEIVTSSGDKATLTINPDLKSGNYKSKSRDSQVKRQ